MHSVYFLLVLAISVAAAPKKEQDGPEMDKEATDKLPPMDPQKGTFCIFGGYNPYCYPYYGNYGYYSPLGGLLSPLVGLLGWLL
ncbi:hypothetical protein V3C99_010023 [Haemonchus contortus]